MTEVAFLEDPKQWIDRRSMEVLVCASVGALAGRIIPGLGSAREGAIALATAGAAASFTRPIAEKYTPTPIPPYLCIVAAAIFVPVLEKGFGAVLATSAAATGTIYLWGKSPTANEPNPFLNLPAITATLVGWSIGKMRPDWFSSTHGLVMGTTIAAHRLGLFHLKAPLWKQAVKPYRNLTPQQNQERSKEIATRIRLFCGPIDLLSGVTLLALPAIISGFGYKTTWWQAAIVYLTF